VFWIDASSHERIKQTFAQIAKIGEVEPNQNAAMHWLSNLEERWLLIIDNADDPSVGLEQYFPKGDRGYILVTTRNPAHKVYGNVGLGFFEFHGMEDDDARALLLRGAGHPEPWDADSSSWAAKITRQLGFLALALTHAGAAIRSGLCSLRDYLTFYDKNWERIRRKRSLSMESRDGDDYLSAYATYEVSYHGIEQKGTEASNDALQLLKTFAFFYFENIRADILKKAVLNAEIEETQEEKNKEEEAGKPRSWPQTFKNMKLTIFSFILQNRSPQTLPYLIRDARDSHYFDNVRLRYALRELVQMSLITYYEVSDSYSMHPLVHKWARERPEMTTSEQGVWSQAAATTLAHSILLPPLGDTEAEELYRRDILPHIDHVQKCQQAIKDRITETRKERWYGLLQWPGAESRFDRDRALLYAKYSIVYAHGGRWNEAEALQLAVKNYTQSVLGLDQAHTRRISLALAGTYWHQGRGDDAADLQNTVLQACLTHLGPHNHETLMVMDTLGQTRWQQGRYSDARLLQQQAVNGLIKLKGLHHEDTLTAMNNLGRIIAGFYENLGEAKTLISEAVKGMERSLGPTHLKTLIAKENLATLALQIKSDLHKASELMTEVLDLRTKKLGKEHPYTLLAMVNMANIKSALGQHQEAESLIRKALPIADRNLCENHIGTLMGRAHLGAILVRQARYDEAETTLLDVIERQRHLSAYRGDFHPDRLGAMMELSGCYRLQGKIDDSIRLCDEAIEGLRRISLKEHPLERKMKEQRRELIQMKNADMKDSGGCDVKSKVDLSPSIDWKVRNPTW
jgi:tetratricopeptide (TPR) repeat protein